MRNASDLKQKNIIDIIKVIRNSGPVTAPQIARMTRLSAVTVHSFIDELIDKNLVLEVGSSKSNGGRKALLFKLNENFGYIIGQSLGRSYISTTVHDLNLKMLYKKIIRCSLDYSERITALMIEEIATAIGVLNYCRKDCIGIGISVPGQVNHDTGVIINIPDIPNWNSIPMKSMVENRLGIRTYVDNDNNAIALSTKWLNIVSESADAVIINITDGVGTGVLYKGKLLYGNHSYAGEIGHTTVDYNGPKCNCGSRGCIEALASDGAIIDKVKRNKRIAINAELVTIETIINSAKAGDGEVHRILKDTGKIVSIAIDHIIKVYDPEVIIIISNWINEFPDLYHQILDDVFTRCSWARRDSLAILVNTLNSFDTNSSASIVLEKVFVYEEDNLLLGIMSDAVVSRKVASSEEEALP
jgi:predicted NBD/HSP70 family sugar kinase